MELYNPTGFDVDLTDWSIQGSNGADASPTASTKWTGASTIPAGGHFLIVGADYTASTAPGGDPPGDDTLTRGITDSESLVLYDASGDEVDAVCYEYNAATLANLTSGSFLCNGTPVSNAPHDDKSSATSNVDASIRRIPTPGDGNCTDTGDNAADFVACAPAVPEDAEGQSP